MKDGDWAASQPGTGAWGCGAASAEASRARLLTKGAAPLPRRGELLDPPERRAARRRNRSGRNVRAGAKRSTGVDDSMHGDRGGRRSAAKGQGLLPHAARRQNTEQKVKRHSRAEPARSFLNDL